MKKIFLIFTLFIITLHFNFLKAQCFVLAPVPNNACYNTVINDDLFCCFDAWDGFCQAAYDDCMGGGGGPIGGTGCNTDISICTPGVAGPFGFGTASPNPSSCLDYLNGVAAPNYAYIILYITTTGNLNLLIDGNSTTGCVDVSIFDITSAANPCSSLNIGSEIGCNYASDCDGCAQFGSTFPGCLSDVPAPFVNAGDILMILVEDYSDEQTSFTLELSNTPGSAQTGPPDATINPVGPFCSTDASVQLTAENMGGDWTGPGTSLTGIFNPATAGLGTHTIDYTIGSAPCDDQDQTTVTVIDCSAPCNIDNFTVNVGACDPATNTFGLTGTVQFTNPPTTGTLTVSDCNGNQQVFNAPFASPLNYNISGITADGAACNITAVFSSDATCTQNIGYLNPAPCLPPCNIDNFTVNINPCEIATDTYTVDGTVEFSNPPVGGSLVISVNNGTGTFETTVALPVASPFNYSILGIPSDGSNTTITAFFTSDAGCTSSIDYTAPASCTCPADIGTFTSNLVGDGNTDFVLCDGDEFHYSSNGDYTVANDQASATVTYDPGIAYLIYSCPPNYAIEPNTDPCLEGLYVAGDDMVEINDMLLLNSFPPGTFTNSTIYFVPITMYSIVDLFYSVTTGLGGSCYDLGPAIAVQYLTPITSTQVEDCQAGTLTVTVNGGLPALTAGEQFTASGLTPATASFDNTTTTNGGTIVVSGLNGGDNYSFTITDANGCPHLITGGPFTPLEDPTFNYSSASYCTSEGATLPNITGTPGGTFTSTPAGLNINAVNGQITPGSSTSGTYDVTYTTPGAICFQSSTVTVTISPTPIVDPVLNQNVCIGTDFNAINFTGSLGATYDWTNTNPAIGLAANGTGNITAFSGVAAGSGTITVTPTVGTCVGNTINFTLTVDPLDDASFTYPSTSYCTSEANPSPNITGTAGGTFTSTPAGLSINAGTGLINLGASAPNTYTVTYTTVGACPDNQDFVISVAATPSVDPVANQTVCEGDNFTTITFTGAAGTTFNWTNTNTTIGLGANGVGNISGFSGSGTVIGGVPISGTTEVTPVAGTCVGTPTDFTLTVNPFDNPAFNYPATSYCSSEANPTANITGLAGGTFTSSPAGLVINATSGLIDLAASTPDTYTITYTTNGICPQSEDFILSIAATPSVDPVVNQTVCEGDNFTTITFTGAAGTTFNWTNTNPAIGLVANGVGNITGFTGTGTVVGGASISGTIEVTPVAGTCVGIPTDFTLTVNPLPNIQAGPDQAICDGTAVTVNGNGAGVGGMYNWTSGLGTVVNDGVNFNPSNTDTYTVVGTDANGCENSDNLEIVVNYSPPVDAGLDVTICEGENVTLTADNPDGAVIAWDNAVVNGVPFSPGVGTVIYTVTADLAGCISTDNVTVIVNEVPDFTLVSNDPSACGANDGNIIISGLNPGTNYEVTYNDGVVQGPTTMMSNGAGEITINGLIAGSYSGVTVSLNGCSNTLPDIFNLVDPNAPDINAGPDQTICVGEQVTLTADNPDGATLNWNNGVVNGVPFSPGTTQNYIVTANLAGCISTDQVTVTVNPLPVIDAGANQSVCAGTLVVLTANNPNGATLNWDNGVIDGQGFTPVSTTTYTVTANLLGCISTDDVTVVVNPIPTIDFEADVLEGCQPLVVNFTDLSTPSGVNCTWLFGDGNTGIGCGTVTNIYNSVGQYDVTLTLTTAAGCSNSGTIENYINVTPMPDALFGFSPTSLTVENTEVEFTNSSTNATHYLWTFGDESPFSTQFEPYHVYPSNEPGSYLVTLVAFAGNDPRCVDTATAYIHIQDVIIFYVPNVFTPDGDNFNEIFQPVFTSGFDPYDYQLLIFNRWGEIVFESNNASVGWNGTYPDGGDLCQDGVYVWKIVFKETMSDKRHTHTGHVTLLK